MKKHIIAGLVISFAALSFGGCAQLVTKRYGSNKGGTVKYSKGFFLDEKNRDKALTVANDYCSPGRAVLTSEEDKREFSGYSRSTTRHRGNRSYTNTSESASSVVYLNFRCSGRSGYAHND